MEALFQQIKLLVFATKAMTSLIPALRGKPPFILSFDLQAIVKQGLLLMVSLL